MAHHKVVDTKGFQHAVEWRLTYVTFRVALKDRKKRLEYWAFFGSGWGLELE